MFDTQTANDFLLELKTTWTWEKAKQNRVFQTWIRQDLNVCFFFALCASECKLAHARVCMRTPPHTSQMLKLNLTF